MRFNKNDIENMIDEKIKFSEKQYGKGAKALIMEILSLERMLRPNEQESRLIPLPMWNKYHDYPTVSGMRMKVFNEDNNGFKDFGVVHREGKRVFIDEQAYFRWRKRNQSN